MLLVVIKIDLFVRTADEFRLHVTKTYSIKYSMQSLDSICMYILRNIKLDIDK